MTCESHVPQELLRNSYSGEFQTGRFVSGCPSDLIYHCFCTERGQGLIPPRPTLIMEVCHFKGLDPTKLTCKHSDLFTHPPHHFCPCIRPYVTSIPGYFPFCPLPDANHGTYFVVLTSLDYTHMWFDSHKKFSPQGINHVGTS